MRHFGAELDFELYMLLLAFELSFEAFGSGLRRLRSRVDRDQFCPDIKKFSRTCPRQLMTIFGVKQTDLGPVRMDSYFKTEALRL